MKSHVWGCVTGCVVDNTCILILDLFRLLYLKMQEFVCEGSHQKSIRSSNINVKLAKFEKNDEIEVTKL